MIPDFNSPVWTSLVNPESEILMPEEKTGLSRAEVAKHEVKALHSSMVQKINDIDVELLLLPFA